MTDLRANEVASDPGAGRWLTAVPDAVAFAGGLSLAWCLDWQVRDLVWSLWLSSLVVGYSMIVWRIFGPAVIDFFNPPQANLDAGNRIALFGVRIFGGLFLLAFFTLHFGMFHFIHSVFLNTFFPILVDGHAKKGFPTRAIYAVVFRSYWYFLPLAAIAERSAYRIRATAEAGDGFMEAYKNVIRMHFLIFFFFLAHLLKIENFGVYAVVYAVYFFPWRLLKESDPQAPNLGGNGSPGVQRRGSPYP